MTFSDVLTQGLINLSPCMYCRSECQSSKIGSSQVWQKKKTNSPFGHSRKNVYKYFLSKIMSFILSLSWYYKVKKQAPILYMATISARTTGFRFAQKK